MLLNVVSEIKIAWRNYMKLVPKFKIKHPTPHLTPTLLLFDDDMFTCPSLHYCWYVRGRHWKFLPPSLLFTTDDSCQPQEWQTEGRSWAIPLLIRSRCSKCRAVLTMPYFCFHFLTPHFLAVTSGDILVAYFQGLCCRPQNWDETWGLLPLLTHVCALETTASYEWAISDVPSSIVLCETPPWNLRKGVEHPQYTWRILPLARLPLPMHMCPCSWMVEATTITEWAAFCYLQCTDTHCMHLGRDRAPPICGIKHWNWEFKWANKKQRYLFWLNQPYLFVHEIFEAAKSSWAWISARKGMAVNNKLKGMAEIDKLNYTWPAMVFHFQTPSDKLLYWLFAIIKKSECNLHY